MIDKVKRFGGIKEDDSKLMIISSLEEKNLLSNNTTVMYKHNPDHSLPEDYNGLGYMNLISMIFEKIKTKMVLINRLVVLIFVV